MQLGPAALRSLSAASGPLVLLRFLVVFTTRMVPPPSLVLLGQYPGDRSLSLSARPQWHCCGERGGLHPTGRSCLSLPCRAITPAKDGDAGTEAVPQAGSWGMLPPNSALWVPR